MKKKNFVYVLYYNLLSSTLVFLLCFYKLNKMSNLSSYATTTNYILLIAGLLVYILAPFLILQLGLPKEKTKTFKSRMVATFLPERKEDIILKFDFDIYFTIYCIIMIVNLIVFCALSSLPIWVRLVTFGVCGISFFFTGIDIVYFIRRIWWNY